MPARRQSVSVKETPTPNPASLSGAKIILKVLEEEGVDTLFGYPGGAVLPIYDALYEQTKIRHILVRHEQAAAHAAEGYARSTGKVGTLLVTSGPGATNTVTGLADAFLDSTPLVCLTGQVPTSLLGTNAFQEADTVGITRACVKCNFQVKDVEDLAETLREAFRIARTGRPGPVVVDLPKDVQFAESPYEPSPFSNAFASDALAPNEKALEQAILWLTQAQRPILYTGGGVISAGEGACKTLRTFVQETNIPITSTLMGLGAFPASDRHFLGMLGMHGTYEANLAMHGCDVMLTLGARFDDRVTGKISGFSPNSKKIQIDIDTQSINKCVKVDLGIVGDVGKALKKLLPLWRTHKSSQPDLTPWWNDIETWRKRDCLSYRNDSLRMKPQLALKKLKEATNGKDVYFTTEVGQHQMWAAQHLRFDQPKHFITSGGLGTMGYGFPAALGVQIAHPQSLVIDVAGDASILMNIQEMATAVQHRLPVKIFVLNNSWMGMVKQWQQLLHGSRYSQTHLEAMPDLVKLAEAFGGVGLRAETESELEEALKTMLTITDRPTIVDVLVDGEENCLPMIPSGKNHNEMLLPDTSADLNKVIEAAGRTLV